MGASLAYLEEPIKEIEFETGEDDRQMFAVGEMQGWRLNMVCISTLYCIGSTNILFEWSDSGLYLKHNAYLRQIYCLDMVKIWSANIH